MDDILWCDATAQAAAIRDGSISAVELATRTLARIDELNPLLTAYVGVDRDALLLGARAADERLERDGPAATPPFNGVAVSIKDVEDVAGLPTTHSCKVLAHNRATTDAPIVRRFRQAGLVVVGKTHVPEFCSSMTSSELFGVCRNPWNRERTPGGSSGGAAAALAAALCGVAHGTDGAGSVRVPAAFCGLVGLKPSRGLVAFGPDEGHPYFGTAEHGALTRSVRDAAAVLDAMVGRLTGEPAWSPRPDRGYAATLAEPLPPLRIAVSTAAPYADVQEACANAAQGTAEVLRRAGHVVEEAAPDWMTILSAAMLPMSVPGAAALIPTDQHHLLEPRNREMIAREAALTVVEHARLVEAARSATRAFTRFWEHYDVLLTPTSGIEAPAVTWAPWDQTPEQHHATFASFPNFAQPFNVSGQPAISLPVAESPDGLPVGVQLAGRHLDEARLLRLAAEIESLLPWSHRRPPLS